MKALLDSRAWARLLRSVYGGKTKQDASLFLTLRSTLGRGRTGWASNSLQSTWSRVWRLAPSRASRAGVRSGRPSEARPRSAAEDRPTLDRRTPQILIWGMGGAAVGLPEATAARRACA